MKEGQSNLGLWERLGSLPEGNHTIAIDGRCAAGKTTLADALAEKLQAAVIHMDDFFLPGELRTAERLKKAGGNVHYERFLEEVIPYLNRELPFSYRRFDCSSMELGEMREISPSRFTIVEGAYSCHPLFGNYMSLRVFMDVEEKLQMERIMRRDGRERLALFREKWIPMEEAYFKEYGIADTADIILGKGSCKERLKIC